MQFDLSEADKPEDRQKDSCLSHGFEGAALQQLKEDLLGTVSNMMTC